MIFGRPFSSKTTRPGGSSFQKITESFLSCSGLPFDSVLTKEKIHEIFAKHNRLFAATGIYSTAVVLWAFLGQVLRDGKEASCQSAVACIIDFCLLGGMLSPIMYRCGTFDPCSVPVFLVSEFLGLTRRPLTLALRQWGADYAIAVKFGANKL